MFGHEAKLALINNAIPPQVRCECPLLAPLPHGLRGPAH